jgi:dienelactone hydrolase
VCRQVGESLSIKLAAPPLMQIMKQVRRYCYPRAIRSLFFVALLYFGANTAMSVHGQTLVVHPRDGMMDERLAINVINLQPQQPVIIRASIQDADGKLWQSYAGFYADDRGAVNLATQAPVNGTYAGVDAMGLIQSMNLPGADYNRARFTYKGANPITIRFSVEIAGQNVALTEVTRNFMGPQGKMMDVRDGGLVGTLFMPPGEGPFPGIIVLGGSDGGLNSEDVAALLSSRGYAALALAYFGIEGLPPALEEIPLEYFKRAIDWMLRQRLVKDNGLAIVGTSKGAEAALLVGSYYREVRAVVGYVPSGVVWSCICGASNKSSWSFGGKSVPYIPQSTDPTYRPPQGFPIRPAINYAYRLRNQEATRLATIPVERINGPVLLISAKDDQLWPSFVLAKMVMDRLKRRGHPFVDQHLAYDSAGHLIGKGYLPAGSTLVAGGRLATGGTPEGNARAQEDSWPKVLGFLQAVFRSRTP